MRIKVIKTEGLFGIFHHEIPLKMDDRITIIHGPNGFGKTAILRLVSDIFESRHTAISQLPFKQVILEFDDDTILTVSKLGRHPDTERRSVIYDYPPNAPFDLSEDTDFEEWAAAIDRRVPYLTRIDFDRWRDDRDGELLGMDDIIDRFADYVPSGARNAGAPDWLVTLRNSLDVHFIKATRLESSRVEDRPARRVPRRRPRHSNSVVGSYAEELADHIRGTLARYAELSQSLDRSFPRRLVTATKDAALSMENVRTRLSELEDKRGRLTGAGLLDQETEAYFDVSSIDETKAEVLSLYIADVEEKLAVFDGLYARIDLLKTILNRRFSFKTVAIDKSDGIEFRTDDGAILAPEDLSSGEQHEVVLLYQLLFRVKRDSLILIDEPELSLHIAWQEMFLQDLEQITSLSSFDVLIATHSPQIISDRWDLTVELKGPNK